MKKTMLILILFFLLFSVTGCYTARSNPDKLMWRSHPLVFDKPYDQVWNACVRSLENGRYSIVTKDYEKGKLVGIRPDTPFRIGGVLEIEVISLGEKATRIDFVSKGAGGGLSFDTGATNASWYLKGVGKLLRE